MEEKEVQDILIDILFSALNETKLEVSIKEKITSDVLKRLYDLARKQDLSHILSSAVYHNGIAVEPEVQVRLQRKEYMAVCRCEKMKRTFTQICEIFDDAAIPYIPLKGSVLRSYYPIDSMRTSCDIDFLVHEEDLASAIGALEQKGYSCAGRHYHDVSLYSPNKIHLELHFNIQENRDNLDAVLKDAWKHVVLEEGNRYKFTDEFFTFHMFAHMAYHFLSGGCGIRSLMDIWVMKHNMGLSYVCAQHLLEKAGILQFAMEMSDLAERCFTNNNRDAFSDMVLAYIFKGGVYGSTSNCMAVKKAKANSTFLYVLRRLFLPYRAMVSLFPILNKAPFLLPFCWIARWLSKLIGGRTKKAIREMTYVNNLSDSKIEEIKSMYSRLGL